MKHTFRRLAAILLILAALGAFLVPGAAAADAVDSYEDQVKAVLEVTRSYYCKNPYMQYDSVNLTSISKQRGGMLRTTRYVAPEYGTADRNIYTVCSSFCFEVYYNTFGYQLMGDPRDAETIDLAAAEAPLMVYSSVIAPETLEQTLKDFRANLQPADVVVWRATDGSGHAMMYVGDIDGDGNDYFIHSAGGKYDMTKGTDSVEAEGNIKKDPAASYLDPKSGYYIGSKKSIHILRPLATEECRALPILPAARQRMKYSGLTVDRTVSCGLYGSPSTGDEITYKLVIKNNSKGDYTVPVVENIPAGTTFVSADGLTGTTTLTADVALKAGESKTVSYTVKVTAARGTIIDNSNGSVAEIPSNSLKNRVAGEKIDAAKLQATGWRSGVAAAKPTGLEFANAVYREALGKELGFTTTEALLGKMLPSVSQGIYNVSSNAADTAIMIDNYVGGTALNSPWEAIDDRIFELRPEQFQAGDIFVAGGNNKDKNPVVLVSTGKELLGMESGRIVNYNTAKLMTLFKKNLFVGLRPNLAVDTLPNAAPKAEVKMPFTDVKEGDWFYEFVKELYGLKIVAGMTDTTFVPNGKLTYGQALKLITCGLGFGEKVSTTSHWANGYLIFAKDKKWLDKDVDLNGPISRLAFCQIAAKAKGLTAQPASNPFKDCADQDVLALVNAGIINGMTADTFAPNNTLTRAQISKIISGLIK